MENDDETSLNLLCPFSRTHALASAVDSAEAEKGDQNSRSRDTTSIMFFRRSNYAMIDL
jgi:hypothetical protein